MLAYLIFDTYLNYVALDSLSVLQKKKDTFDESISDSRFFHFSREWTIKIIYTHFVFLYIYFFLG